MMSHSSPRACPARADPAGHADLADVVQQRGVPDALHLDLVEAERGGDRPGHVDDEGRVLAGVAVALDEGGGQRLDDVGLGAEGVDAALGRPGGGAGAAVGTGAIQPARGRGQQALDRRAEAMRSDAGRTVMNPAHGISVPSSSGDEALAAGARAAHRRAGHEDGELVGARAPDDVGRAREAAQALGDGEQGGVAGGRAAPGVQRAEAVDVDQRARPAARRARRAPGRLGVAAEGLERQKPGAASMRARSASWASRPSSRARASASARRSSWRSPHSNTSASRCLVAER